MPLRRASIDCRSVVCGGVVSLLNVYRKRMAAGRPVAPTELNLARALLVGTPGTRAQLLLDGPLARGVPAPGHAGRVRPAARRLRPAGPRRCAPNFAASSPATSSVAGSRLTLRPGWRRTQSGRAAPRPDRATTSTSPPDLGHGYASAAGVWFMRCLGSARRSGIGPSWRRGRITPFRLVVPTHLGRTVVPVVASAV